MIIVWARPAKESFTNHIRYLLDVSPVGAKNVKQLVMENVKMLETTPLMGRPGRWENTRELIIAKYPYIVVYRVKGTVVEILYVHNSWQEWPSGEEK